MENTFEVDLDHGFNILMNVNVMVINNNFELKHNKLIEALIGKVAHSGSFEAARFVNLKLDHAASFLEEVYPISKRLDEILVELSTKRPVKDVKRFQLSRIRSTYPDAFVHTEPSPLSQNRFSGGRLRVQLPKKIKLVHAKHVGSDATFARPKHHKINVRMRDFYSQLDEKKEMVEHSINNVKASILNNKRLSSHKRIDAEIPNAKSRRINEDENEDALFDVEGENEELQQLLRTHVGISDLLNIVNDSANLPPELEPIPLPENAIEKIDIHEEINEDNMRHVRKWFSTNLDKLKTFADNRSSVARAIETKQDSDIELLDDFGKHPWFDMLDVEEKLIKYNQALRSNPELGVKDRRVQDILTQIDDTNQQVNLESTIYKILSLSERHRTQYEQDYLNKASKNPHLVKAMHSLDKASKAKNATEVNEYNKEAYEHVMKSKPTERKAFHMSKQNLDFYKDLKLPSEKDVEEMHRFMKTNEFLDEQELLNNAEQKMRKVPYSRKYFGEKLKEYWSQENERADQRIEEDEQWLGTDRDVAYHKEVLDGIKQDKLELENELSKNHKELAADPKELYRKYANVIWNKSTLSKMWDGMNVTGTKDNEIPERHPSVPSTTYDTALEKFRTLQLLLEQQQNQAEDSPSYNRPYLNMSKSNKAASKNMKSFQNTDRLDTYILRYFADNFHNIESPATPVNEVIEDLVDTLSTEENKKHKPLYKHVLNERYKLLSKQKNPTIQRDLMTVHRSQVLPEENEEYDSQWQREGKDYTRYATLPHSHHLEKLTATNASPTSLNRLIEGLETRITQRNATSTNIRDRIKYFQNKSSSDGWLEEQTASGLKNMKTKNPIAYKFCITDHRSPPETTIVDDDNIADNFQQKMITTPFFIEPHEKLKTISHQDYSHNGDQNTHAWDFGEKSVGCTVMDGSKKEKHFIDVVRHPHPILHLLQINHNQDEELQLNILQKILSAFHDPAENSPIHHHKSIGRTCNNFFHKAAEQMHYCVFPTNKMDDFSRTLMGSTSLGHCLSDSIDYPKVDHDALRQWSKPTRKLHNSMISHIPLTKDHELLCEKSKEHPLMYHVSPAGSGIGDNILKGMMLGSLGYTTYKGNQVINTISDMWHNVQNFNPEFTSNPNWEKERMNMALNSLIEGFGLPRTSLIGPPSMPDDVNLFDKSLAVRPPATSGRFDQLGATSMLNRLLSFLTNSSIEVMVRLGVLPPAVADITKLVWSSFVLLSNYTTGSTLTSMILLYTLRGKILPLLKTIPKPFQWTFNKMFAPLLNMTPMDKTVPTPDTTKLHSTTTAELKNLNPDVQSFLGDLNKTFEGIPASNLEITTRALKMLGYPAMLAPYILKQLFALGGEKTTPEIAYGITPNYIVKEMVPKLLKGYPPFYKVLYNTNFVNTKHANFWSSPTWKQMGNLGPSMENLMKQVGVNANIGQHASVWQPPLGESRFALSSLGLNQRPELLTAPSVPKNWHNGLLATLMHNYKHELEKEGLVGMSPTQVLDTKTNHYYNIQSLMNTPYDDLSSDQRQVAKNLGMAFKDTTSRTLFKHAIPNDENMDRNPDLTAENKWLRTRLEWNTIPGEILQPTVPKRSAWSKAMDYVSGNWSEFDVDKTPTFLKEEVLSSMNELKNNKPVDTWLTSAKQLSMPTKYKSSGFDDKTINFDDYHYPKGTIATQAKDIAIRQVKTDLKDILWKSATDLDKITTFLESPSQQSMPTGLYLPEDLIKTQQSALHQLQDIHTDHGSDVISQGELQDLIESSVQKQKNFQQSVDNDAGMKLQKHMTEMIHYPNHPQNVNVKEAPTQLGKILQYTFPEEEFVDAQEYDYGDLETGAGIRKKIPKVRYAPHNTIVLHVLPNTTYTMCSGNKGGSLQSILPLWDSNIDVRGAPSDQLLYDLEKNWFQIHREPAETHSPDHFVSVNPDDMPSMEQMKSSTKSDFEREHKIPKTVKIVGQLQMTQPTLTKDKLIRSYKFFGLPKVTQVPIVHNLYHSTSSIEIKNDMDFHEFLKVRDPIIPPQLREDKFHVLPILVFMRLPKIFY